MLVWGTLGQDSDIGGCNMALGYMSGATTLFSVYGIVYWAWVCMGRANMCTSVSSLQLRARGRSVKGLRLPEAQLHRSSTPPLSEVAWSLSRDF